ncbi:MAG: RNA 2'-phosphotransferase [Deinococcales bacterium]
MEPLSACKNSFLSLCSLICGSRSVSKFLSLILRHKPEEIGLQLDQEGWANIQDLIVLANKKGDLLSEDLIREIVETNDKKRFTISSDGKFIKANQGHSIQVDLGLVAIEPPKVLFHGTASRFVESIIASGLSKRNRHHVHLSTNVETAKAVGRRYGSPVVLVINSAKMFLDGHTFYKSDNDVWLTEEVPSRYILIS